MNKPVQENVCFLLFGSSYKMLSAPSCLDSTYSEARNYGNYINRIYIWFATPASCEDWLCWHMKTSDSPVLEILALNIIPLEFSDPMILWFYEYMLGITYLESILAEKDLRVLVEIKLNISWIHAFAAEKANCVLGCIRQNIVSRFREVIFPVYSALIRPHLESCIQFCALQRDIDVLEKVQQRAKKMMDWSISQSSSLRREG